MMFKNYKPLPLDERLSGHYLDGAISIYDHEKDNVEKSVPMNTFNKVFMQMFLAQVKQAQTSGVLSVVDTGGVARTCNETALQFRCGLAGAGDTTFGIVVGTGSTAYTLNDYALETKIAHGIGSGQLSYGAMSCSSHTLDLVSSPTNAYFTMDRTFTNNSGAGITVNELGLYTYMGTSYRGMVDRTLNTFTINDGASKTVTYTIKIEV